MKIYIYIYKIFYKDICNFKFFSDLKYSENSNKFSLNYTSLIEDSKKDITTKKTIRNINVPIIPNDRNIPIFLEDNKVENQCNLYDNIKFNQKSK